MSDDTKRVRFNLTVDPATRQLVEHYTEEWGLDNGRTLDRLVKMAVGTQAAERQAEAGLGALEEMTRRLLGDYTDLMTRQLKELLDGPHIEASTARLLLFALLAAWKGPHAAALNEDHAVRIARQARADGRFPQMPRSSRDDEENAPTRPQRWPAPASVVVQDDQLPTPKRRWFTRLLPTPK